MFRIILQLLNICIPEYDENNGLHPSPPEKRRAVLHSLFNSLSASQPNAKLSRQNIPAQGIFSRQSKLAGLFSDLFLFAGHTGQNINTPPVTTEANSAESLPKAITEFIKEGGVKSGGGWVEANGGGAEGVGDRAEFCQEWAASARSWAEPPKMRTKSAIRRQRKRRDSSRNSGRDSGGGHDNDSCPEDLQKTM